MKSKETQEDTLDTEWKAIYTGHLFLFLPSFPSSFSSSFSVTNLCCCNISSIHVSNHCFLVTTSSIPEYGCFLYSMYVFYVFLLTWVCFFFFCVKVFKTHAWNFLVFVFLCLWFLWLWWRIYWWRFILFTVVNILTTM